MTITPETITNLEEDCIHIAEIAVGKEGGTSGGVAIDTSTDRLGQVKKTIPKILTEMESGLLTMSNITFSPVSASSVANNSIFVNSTTGKISFKDGSGVVTALY